MIKILIVIILAFFLVFLGIIIGHYEIFPYSILKDTKIILTNKNLDHESMNAQWHESDIDSLIRISTDKDVLEKQTALIQYIWKTENIPSNSDLLFENKITDLKYKNLKNLQNIDKFTVSMEKNVNSISYLFHSKTPNGNLIIYHQGHRGDFIHGIDTIQVFLDEGYDVLAFTLPLLGMNNQPIVDVPNFGKIKLTTHNHLKFLESDDFSPIVYFLEPITISLNYIDEHFDYKSYSILGISTGGWTATLYSALDERISNSFSVAGSYPIYLRNDPKNFGDYEQTVPELYALSNYLELYIMSAYGENRTHIQFFNKNDPCCFSGNAFISYEEHIKNKIFELENGNFQIYLDETHNKHKISNYVIDIILEELN
jgi:hypothetical protein